MNVFYVNFFRSVLKKLYQILQKMVKKSAKSSEISYYLPQILVKHSLNISNWINYELTTSNNY